MHVCVQAQVPAGLGCVLILTGEEQESAPYNLDGIEVPYITVPIIVIIILKKTQVTVNQQIKR